MEFNGKTVTAFADFTVDSSDVMLGAVLDNTAVNISCGAKINGLRSHAFTGCTTLESVSLPNLTGMIGGFVFSGCTALRSVNLPNANSFIGVQAFNNTAITSILLPKVNLLYANCFQGASKLEKAEFHNVEVVYNDAFPSTAIAFKALILRRNAVCQLYTATAFDGGNIGNGTAFIYVPASLVDSYKAATNWTNYASQIRAIEDYPDITGG